MEKWADYGVSRVKYNRDHTAIIEVEVQEDLGDNFGTRQKVARTDVVASIDRGYSFVTLYSRDGQLTKGEDVGVVTVHRERFLRTDRNAVKSDNLGSLPEYV